MKKLIAILTAVLMLAVLLAACGEETAPADTTPTIVTDANGAYILPTDASGEAVLPTDASGNAIMPTDASGEPALTVDADGHVSPIDRISPDTYIGGYYTGVSGVVDSGSGSNSANNNSGSSSSNNSSNNNSNSNNSGNNSGSNNSAQKETTVTDDPEEVEDEIPVIIATLPDDEDLYELPII